MSQPDKGQAEPSMEEILASIRRIISDDKDEEPKAEDAAPDQAAAPATAAEPSAPAAPKEEIRKEISAGSPAPAPVVEAPKPDAEEMVLTEIVEEEPSAEPGAATPPPAAATPPNDEELAEEGRAAFLEEAPSAPVAPKTVTPKARPEAAVRHAPEPRPAASGDSDYDGLVSPPIKEQSTQTLAALAEVIHAKGFNLGNVHMTLEDLIRDLLRPHLKDWLDRNLPTIVERLVRAEIERMSREAEERKDLI